MDTSNGWELSDAIILIRRLEESIKEKHHCFLGLCGGVLRKGYSEKDLDIVIIPMNANSPPPDVVGAMLEIGGALGVEFKPVNAAEYNKQEFISLQFYGAEWNGKRIELLHVK